MVVMRDILKWVSAVVFMSVLFVGCASFNIRNWNPEQKTGRIVIYSYKNLLSEPEVKDFHDELMKKCPSGYEIQGEGWTGSGILEVSRAEDPKPATTTSSINVGGREVLLVGRSKGGKSGGFQTESSADGKGVTVVQSPASKKSASQEGKAKYFDFKCE